MDQIDLNLLEAWNRIGAKCRTDRLEALKRYSRTHKDVMRRIPRDCCLCIRAADARINSHTAAIEFDEDLSSSDVPQALTSTELALKHGVAHTVTLAGERIRKVCAPVMIDWPGIPASDAARRLGLSPRSLDKWIECGWVQILRYDNAMSLGRRGKPVPIVWTPTPIDPCAIAGEPPDSIWGTLWQWQHEKIPMDHVLTAKRVPRWREFRGRGKRCLIGWDWICPGLANMAPCEKRVRTLYGPLTLWTLPRVLDSALSLEMPVDSRLIGEWRPGMNDPLIGRRMFACNRCWNIQGMTMTDERGWNLFVSHMTGGLLFGHEVERPRMEAPAKRKKKFAARPNRRAIGLRVRIIDLSMLGFDRARIARSLRISMSCLDGHIRKIHREHRVRNRVELALKLGQRLKVLPRPIPQRIVERRKKVRMLREQGLSLRQIAVRLKINLKTAHADVKELTSHEYLAPAFAGDNQQNTGVVR